MGATTVLPPSLLPRRCATADLHSCAPRVGIHPSCVANPASLKKPKSPSSVRSGEPPAKRVGGAGEPRPSSVRGRDPPSKRVGGAGELRLAAATDNIGSKKRSSSFRGGDPPAKRVRAVAEPHLAAAADSIGSKKRSCPRSDKDLKSSTHRDAATIKNLAESMEQANPSSSTMSDLIERARQAKARSAAEERIEIECRRANARRKLEQMVATAEFNDPYLDPADVCMFHQQLREAREAAAASQARIIEKYRQREMEALKRSEGRN